MDIGRKLRALRNSQGYSQSYVAKRLHVSRPTYSNYENGKACMDFFVIEKLIMLYEIDAHYLFDNEVTSKGTGLNALLETERKLAGCHEKDKFWKYIVKQSNVYFEFLTLDS